MVVVFFNYYLAGTIDYIIKIQEFEIFVFNPCFFYRRHFLQNSIDLGDKSIGGFIIESPIGHHPVGSNISIRITSSNTFILTHV